MYTKKKKENNFIKNFTINPKNYPLQKRRKDINTNPIFSYIFNDEKRNFYDYNNENEIISSLKLYNTEYNKIFIKKKKKII